jgi:hypothetical protein
MFKSLATLVVLTITFTHLLGQHTKDFEIHLPGKKVNASLYNSIDFLDSRFDTTHMGIVQLGAFNKKARVVPKMPFDRQLENVLFALTDSTAKQSKLLLQLRQFNFAEITGATSEKGYLYMRADLYVNNNLRYQKLASIDTVVLVKSMDVTNALFRKGSATVTNFIADNLLNTPADQLIYTLNDINNIDSLEKSKIFLYTTDKYTDGVYETFNAFKSQAPDRPAIVNTDKSGKISSVFAIGEDGNKIKLKAKDIYAIVHDGQPFVASEYGYFPLKKVDHDLYFTGRAKVTAKSGDVIAASIFFGIIGGLLASDASAVFEMKIDHLNGGFIHIKEVTK